MGSEIIFEPLGCHLRLLDSLVFDCSPRLGGNQSNRKTGGIAAIGKLSRIVSLALAISWRLLHLHHLLHEFVMRVERVYLGVSLESCAIGGITPLKSRAEVTTASGMGSTRRAQLVANAD